MPRVHAHAQEVDRNEDMIRSCLRAVEAISRIPDAEKCVPFKAFMASVVLAEPMASKYAAIKDERAEAEGLDAMDTS
jgi:cullin-associated NEDD8-dissociated protein 1